MKRKIDYFFQPYSNLESVEKHMRFNELKGVHDNCDEHGDASTKKQKAAENQSSEDQTISQAFSLDLINTLRMRKQQPHDLDQRIQYLWSDFKE